ncbi:hypothetical protein [Ectothiorhodospira shaposhnikovii]|uniref:hypothetical protein n=1 Tax=Ectothiorhodospira shaposhnikovii TaxID=1054 RepID=UPI00190567F3|nr:hypothetical protein [Ectothiorhodospira shaposhnikovii]
MAWIVLIIFRRFEHKGYDMAGREWLLNINAVRAAQRCARLIEQEFSLRMPVGRADFLAQAVAMAQRSSGSELREAVKALERIIAHAPEDRDQDVVAQADEETLVYRGKVFPRYQDGKVFSGIYRGAPVYVDAESAHLNGADV